MEIELKLTINGRKRNIKTERRRTLLELLREDLGLTGTKYGCGEGQCRACTVLLDGEAVASCLTPVSLIEGKEVRTIESLAQGGELHPVQKAFLDEGAMQCGYCVPGMIMTAVGLFEANEHPTEDEIVEAMNGNICRCCGYENLLAALHRAAGIPKEAAGR